LTFEESQQIVGGYVQPVYMEDRTILVNEEGMIHDLPLNLSASRMANQQLLGDVIILSLKEAGKLLNEGAF
jgi:hypothetical protein